ncbi:hypothetical protein LMG8286_01149 [Campylobacter suis]|uniref:Uncharacterized protein n=1 Tax=Campylobacter suis TaxID=2790657 RepID=A0ABN7K6J2_9BACT|nr:hypothetical protein LMG8286_01149 [Campylobacter suis]
MLDLVLLQKMQRTYNKIKFYANNNKFKTKLGYNQEISF